jgi:hypothetical protein
MGNLEFSMMLSVIRKFSGQEPGSPIVVSFQFLERVSSPISPPPERKYMAVPASLIVI